jgi:hypothetical protein
VHHIAADSDNPEYLVEIDKTGAIAGTKNGFAQEIKIAV